MILIGFNRSSICIGKLKIRLDTDLSDAFGKRDALHQQSFTDFSLVHLLAIHITPNRGRQLLKLRVAHGAILQTECAIRSLRGIYRDAAIQQLPDFREQFW